MNTALTPGIAFALLSLASAPAMAQSSGDWTGGYLGGYAGFLGDPNDGDDIEFDTNLDGDFGDTVFTPLGANAFSPGFCDGVAQGPTPGDGCRDNSGGADWGFRGGYDWQSGNWVYGVVAEYGMNDYRDAVSAFSTTPARYTMLRKVDDLWAIRGRVGYAFGDGGRNLVYGTGGYASANVDNTFSTSNVVNTFVDNGNSSADGFQIGLGYERRLSDAFSVGVEYLATRLNDSDYRVRAQGPAPVTNPFLLVNPSGTDFRRGDDSLNMDSFRLTATYRF